MDTSALVDMASADVTPAVDTTVDTPAVDSTVDATTVDTTSDSSAEPTVEDSEKDLIDEKGNARTDEEVKQLREERVAKGEGKDPVPSEVRKALKALRDANPEDKATQATVKQLHGHFERYEAVRPLLGKEGPNGLKNFLSEIGATDITTARQAYAETQTMVEAVKSADELLYNADPTLSKNVYEDMKAQGKEGAYAKVVSNFISHLKEVDPKAHFEHFSRPTLHSCLSESRFPVALNNMLTSLQSGDAKAATAALSKVIEWWNELDEQESETGKISKEREKWEAEKAEAAKGETARATAAWESSVAETADKENNRELSKHLATYLRQPFFKGFPRESLIDLGNGIKAGLYAALRADKTYQTQMNALWKGGNNPTNNTKIQTYHKQTLERLAQNVVASVITKRYPGWAKGGSAAGKAAAAVEKKATDAKAAASSVASGRPIYVATRPTNLVREPIKVAGKEYSAGDLVTLQIAGKGFVKTTDGKGFRLVTWRRS
jgi:hypothetical protein